MVDIIETLYTASGTQELPRVLKWWPYMQVDFWPFYTKVNFGSLHETGSQVAIQDHWSSGHLILEQYYI